MSRVIRGRGRRGDKGGSGLWDKLASASAGGEPYRIDGAILRFERRRSVNKTLYCLSADDYDRFVNHFGFDREIRVKEAGWVNMKEVRERLRLSHEKAKISALFDRFRAVCGKGEIEIGGALVKPEWRMTSGTTRDVFVPEAIVPAIAAYLGVGHKLLKVDEKTSEWLTKKEFAESVGVHRQNEQLGRMWKTFVEDFNQDQPTDGSGDTLRVERKRSGNTTLPLLHVDSVEAARELLSDLSEAKSFKMAG